jgi:imidazole glycerol-phosphate synthase subunit HisH
MGEIMHSPRVAIVDYGLGNLFSVGQACAMAGLQPQITMDKIEIAAADAVILPGVGAFGDAMAHLNRLDLVEPLKDIAAGDKPLLGICLGMQLLMRESYEFGRHMGLGLVEGEVVHFDGGKGVDRYKVPQVGWNRIRPGVGGWRGSLLEDIPTGEYMYFVHSYYTLPEQTEVVLAKAEYSEVEFCAGLRRGNVHAFQFHPERSGASGLKIYAHLAAILNDKASDSKENTNG